MFSLVSILLFVNIANTYSNVAKRKNFFSVGISFVFSTSVSLESNTPNAISVGFFLEVFPSDKTRFVSSSVFSLLDPGTPSAITGLVK